MTLAFIAQKRRMIAVCWVPPDQPYRPLFEKLGFITYKVCLREGEGSTKPICKRKTVKKCVSKKITVGLIH